MALCLGLAAGRAGAADFAKRHAELRAAYADKLADLATWADRAGLAEEARQARAWLPAAEPNRIMLACRPAAGESAAEPFVSSSPEWEDRFRTLRDAQAESLFALAGEAAAGGQASLAFQLLPEVIHENPQHAKAREILGYERHGERWLTPFEAAKAAQNQVWHDRFGWLPADHVARYEAGERFYGGRWMKAEAEQRLRSAPRKGWDIVTEHYNVHTSHSLEAGVKLAVKLERLYDAWQQMFAAFSASEDALARRFAGGAAARSEPRRHKVVYFRDRDEYIRALEKDEPQIGISTGFYIADKREAYFYTDAEADDSNLNHEATHQLFSEMRRSVRDVGRDANFWVIEGIACYMESLVSAEGWHFLGGNDAVRLRDAQHRLTVDNFYVPLAELTTYGMDRLKRDPKIPMLYSEASGLTYFFINFDGGRYRAPLVAYLSDIYQGRDRPGTLAEKCGKSDAELDGQYRQFIESVD